ncbi:hypothetical protein C8Q76DRAFT_220357 [Earliella scabrosa]|nr:hypothetical protein C8Q76DRAFT_220357 [Earliella scabrosa]
MARHSIDGDEVGSSPSVSVQALARLLLSRFGRRAKVLATGLAGESTIEAIADLLRLSDLSSTGTSCMAVAFCTSDPWVEPVEGILGCPARKLNTIRSTDDLSAVRYTLIDSPRMTTICFSKASAAHIAGGHGERCK